MRGHDEAPAASRCAAACHSEPATSRSSRAAGGATPAALVGAPGGAAAVLGGAHQRAAGARRRRRGGGPARRRPGRRSGRPSACRRHQPLLLVAVAADAPRRSRPARSNADRRTAKFAPHTISAGAVGVAQVQGGDRRRLAPARPGAGPSRRTWIGPPKASASGCALGARRPARPASRAAPTRRRPRTRPASPVVAATPVLRAAFRPEPRTGSTRAPWASRDRAGVVGGAVVHHHDLVRGGAALGPERGQRHRQVSGAVPGGYHDGHGHGARLAASVTDAQHPRVLLVHNRYRTVGGEERSVDAAGRGASSTRACRTRCWSAARPTRAGRARPPRCCAAATSPTEVAAAVRDLGADVVHAHNMLPLIGPARAWRPPATRARRWCCTCTTCGCSAPPASASATAARARAAAGATRCPACA